MPVLDNSILDVVLGTNWHSFEGVTEQGTRKAIMVELFIIFIVFFIQAARFPLDKEEEEGQAQPQAKPPTATAEYPSGEDGTSPIPQQTSPTDVAPVIEAPAENALTKEFFHMIINHAIAIGLAQWQPCVFSAIIAWFHLIFFLMLGFARIKDKPVLGKVAHVGSAFINILLLIVGLTNV